MPEPMQPSHTGDEAQTSHTSPAATLTSTANTAATATALAPSPLKQVNPDPPTLDRIPVHDPSTTDIIHNTEDSKLDQISAKVADAGAGAVAVAVSSSQSSASTLSSTSQSVMTSCPPTPGSIAGSRVLSTEKRPPTPRPSINIPLPQPPIGLHHALDGTVPVTPLSKPPLPAKILTSRSTDTIVQNTLAKDSNQQHASAPLQGPGSNGQRRIMTPTSRLAETAAGVREVSKKIGTLLICCHQLFIRLPHQLLLCIRFNCHCGS